MNNHSIATNKTNTNHPTLASETKFAYLFAKTKRFNLKNAQCPQAFYSYQSQLSQRKTGMGYGKKTDIFRKSQNPSSTQYNIKSMFDNDTKGISFGCARQKSPERSYIVPQIQKNPGPGRYENQVDTLMRQKFSIRSKTIDVNTVKATCNFTPGPAAYESINLQNQSGRHKVSKYKDSTFAKIDPNGERFPKIKQSPGPSAYEHNDGAIEEGHYTLSRHAGKGGRVFNRQARFTSSEWKPSKNPGPGKYVLPVQFGILQ